MTDGVSPADRAVGRAVADQARAAARELGLDIVGWCSILPEGELEEQTVDVLAALVAKARQAQDAGDLLTIFGHELPDGRAVAAALIVHRAVPEHSGTVPERGSPDG
jgi:hypothetical protein